MKFSYFLLGNSTVLFVFFLRTNSIFTFHPIWTHSWKSILEQEWKEPYLLLVLLKRKKTIQQNAVTFERASTALIKDQENYAVLGSMNHQLNWKEIN